jgi:single-stranded DNA-binding protein
VVFGKGAEVIAEYRQKGGELGISGRLRPGRPWTDAEGNEHEEPEVVVNDVSLVGGAKSPTAERPEGQGGYSAPTISHPQDNVIINPWQDDDIAY